MTSLDGQPARVIGVLPPGFETPTLAHADLLIPQRLDEATLQKAGHRQASPRDRTAGARNNGRTGAGCG